MKNFAKLADAMRGIAIIALTCALTACPQLDTDLAHAHRWGEWIETTAPTCTTLGVKTRTCALNSSHKETITFPINPDAHQWQPSPSATAPTCTEDGHGDQICAYNADHTKSSTILQLGHDYEWDITTVPTCENEGEETGICTHDNSHITTRPVFALGHDYEWDVIIAPTCTDEGEETGTCARNGLHTAERAVAIDPGAHQWNDDWTVTAAATCAEAGIETATCAHNSLHTTPRAIAIDPGAHDYQWVTIAPTLVQEGVDKETCSRCGDETGNIRNIVSSLPITNAQRWTEALNMLYSQTGNYTLTIGGTFVITRNNFGTTPASGLTVTLKGSGKITDGLYLTGNQTLIIDSEELTLQGAVSVGATAALELRNGTISGNTNARAGGVYVDGTFTMTGGKISGNTAGSSSSFGSSGGGVYVGSGTFIMNGGVISGNTADSGTGTSGGGVNVDSGIFIMNGGTISGNSGYDSSGVYVGSGTFTMTSGRIFGNQGIVSMNGVGGVYVGSGTFTMTGGEVSGNGSKHGGVYVGGGTFTMTGGVISGNAAKNSGGGGVFLDGGTFRIVTGTVYGSNETNATLRNTAAVGYGGAALYGYSGTAQYGTFSGEEWNRSGDLTVTNNTIRVENGVLAE